MSQASNDYLIVGDKHVHKSWAGMKALIDKNAQVSNFRSSLHVLTGRELAWLCQRAGVQPYIQGEKYRTINNFNDEEIAKLRKVFHFIERITDMVMKGRRI